MTVRRPTSQYDFFANARIEPNMTEKTENVANNVAAADVRPLTVVVLSKYRPTLRKLSRFLMQFGYEVILARNVSQLKCAIDTHPFDLAIIDGTGINEEDVCITVPPIVDALRQKQPSAYAIYLLETPRLSTVTYALQAGVDDFLTLPVNLGEALFRLRAGARVVEHRRRGRHDGHRDPVTGLSTTSVFTEKLGNRLQQATRTGSSLACVAINLDFCQRYCSEYGPAFYDRVLAAVAAILASLGDEQSLLGCGGSDQFFIAFNCATENDAVEWGQRFSEQFSARSIQVGQVSLKLTASVGIAVTAGEPLTASDLIARSLDAQGLAKRSGRNTIASYTEVIDETTDWNDVAAPSVLLKETIAQDVMAPCTIVVHSGDPTEHAASLMWKAHLSILPVVDHNEQFLGYLSESQLLKMEVVPERVDEALITDVATFEVDESFATLMNHFIEHPGTLAFILRRGQPVGWVTQNGLISLTASLNDRSFSTTALAEHRTSYLLVADDALVAT